MHLKVAFSHKSLATGSALKRSLDRVNLEVLAVAAAVEVLVGRFVGRVDRSGEDQRLLDQDGHVLVDGLVVAGHQARNVRVVVFVFYFLRPNVIWLLFYHRLDHIVVWRLPNILK